MIRILTTMMIVMMMHDAYMNFRAHNNQVNNYCDSYDNDAYMNCQG